MNKLLRFIARGVVDYAEHLQKMDAMKAEYDLKIALMKKGKQ